MKVRYNMALGIVLVVLGAVCEFLGVWLLLLGEFSPAAVAGLVPLLIGILYLVRPYFVIDARMVTIPAVFGPVRRDFAYQRLELDGGRLHAITADGSRKKVPVARWLANPTDWRSVTSGL